MAEGVLDVQINMEVQEDEENESEEDAGALHDENDADFTLEGERSSKRQKKSDGKWKPNYEGKQFKKEWLDIFPWCEEHPDSPKIAICRACNKNLKALQHIMESHQKTKNHIRNISGCDDIEIEEDKSAKAAAEKQTYHQQLPPPPPPQIPVSNNPQSMHQLQNPYDSIMIDDQMNIFGDQHPELTIPSVTEVVDRLVEKYHENKIENLSLELEQQQQLTTYRNNMAQEAAQRRCQLQLEKDSNRLEAMETQMRLKQEEQEALILALEKERDEKLKSVEQQLVLARQEYEKKVKLLDQQLQYIK